MELDMAIKGKRTERAQRQRSMLGIGGGRLDLVGPGRAARGRDRERCPSSRCGLRSISFDPRPASS